MCRAVRWKIRPVLKVSVRVPQEDPSLLSHLLEALDSGAPPHGGIALGKVAFFFNTVAGRL